jgi:hypothetical protein
MSVPEEEAVRAEETVVVEGLHDGDPLSLGGVARRRGYQRKRIVEMNDIRSGGPDQPPEVGICALIPERLTRKSQDREQTLERSLPRVREDLMTVLSQELSFYRDDPVLTTRKTIRVVYLKNPDARTLSH